MHYIVLHLRYRLFLALNFLSVKTYKHIFFDLDHTLWDFDKSSEETVYELIEHYQLHINTPYTHIEFFNTFRKVNSDLWQLYNVGKTTKDLIRTERFKLIFESLNIPLTLLPKSIGDEYLASCPLKPNLIEYASDILEYLSKKYCLHILTNGFDDVQFLKLKHASINHYFDCIITSESTGKTKPHKKIFEFALTSARTKRDECIMIGDNISTDIEGACNAGIDSVFYNPLGLKKEHKATYEIRHLKELKSLL